ncbi:MAG: hypothetical protein ACXWG4_11545 [Thermoanaerobaculia bacterium]
MATGTRPSDEHYWRQPWSSMLFAGDLFEAIPFGTQPTIAVEADDEDGAHRHYVGAIEFAYGLLISPTCDMTDQTTGGSAHPYRVLVPVVSLEAAYWARAGVDPDALPIFERDEERPGATDWPPSAYDPRSSEFVDQLPAPDWDPEELSSRSAPFA